MSGHAQRTPEFAEPSDRIKKTFEDFNAAVRANNLARARTLADQLIPALKTELGEEHPWYGTALAARGLIANADDQPQEAEELLEKGIIILVKQGYLSHQMDSFVGGLAYSYERQGKTKEIETLYTIMLDKKTSAFGETSLLLLPSIQSLTTFYLHRGRSDDARTMLARATAIANDPKNNNAEMWRDYWSFAGLTLMKMGDVDEAERVLLLAKESLESAGLHNTQDYADVIINVAEAYIAKGQYAAALPLQKQALQVYERELPDVGPTATILSNMAIAEFQLGQLKRAKEHLDRALQITERISGSTNAAGLFVLVNIGQLYDSLGERTIALALLRKAQAECDRKGDRNTNLYAAILNALARVEEGQSNFEGALQHQIASCDILEKLFGSLHMSSLQCQFNIASLQGSAGQHKEETEGYEKVIAGMRQYPGRVSPMLSRALVQLADIYSLKRDYARAYDLATQALDVNRLLYGEGSRYLAASLLRLGDVRMLQDDYEGGAALYNQALRLFDSDAGTLKTSSDDTDRQSALVNRLVLANWGLRNLRPEYENDHASRAFLASQRTSIGSTAQALSLMASRIAAGDGELSGMIRQLQDTDAARRAAESKLVALLALPKTEQRDASVEGLRKTITAATATLQTLGTAVAQRFPTYTNHLERNAVTIPDVQDFLRPDEVLVNFYLTSNASYVWAIAKDQVTWKRLSVDQPALTRYVQTFRCGVDYTAWTSEPCEELTGTKYREQDYERGVPLPFDLSKAHATYVALFGPIEEAIAGKSLLIVPSGVLSQLPFAALLTQGAENTETGLPALRAAQWLVRKHAVAILPSASSLKALRLYARDSRAPLAYLGIGNPLLDGEGAAEARLAQVARRKQDCRRPVKTADNARPGNRGFNVSLHGSQTLDPVKLRRLSPLPETADEICDVARDVNAGDNAVLLASSATEWNIKFLNAIGMLSKYRILHFATHGAIAGELSDGSEPGLVLTPPRAVSAKDDGYLSMSEIAALSLNADWVVLSACNTAAGGVRNAEPLSGIARAFFYAGARALLVSQWAVYSNSTTKLVSGIFSSLQNYGDIGRAEAFRRSMVALIDDGPIHEAHPTHWAAFQFIGETSR